MSSAHLVRKVTDAVERVDLDLSGRRVITEAATGAYAVTPVIAAAAGASVRALAKSTCYGTVEDARRQVMALAAELDMEIAGRIQIVESLTEADIGAADIITNSGHLRPLDAPFIRQMKPGAAIPLMYESWELRPGEVDLQACRRRGVVVAGTNECHPNIRVFDYLGLLALFGLFQCRVPVTLSKLLVVCDNPFCPFIVKSLLACGAGVEVLGSGDVSDLDGVRTREADEPSTYDAVVVANTPTRQPVIGPAGKSKYSFEQIGRFDALVQVWGDVDRTYLGGVTCYPASEPPKGHMGVLLSELGPDPIIRLQAGGLKVGEVLSTRGRIPSGVMAYCQPLSGGDNQT